MNCDQAFDAMTSSEWKSDTELEHHFSGCPRCREMAEVLSPLLTDLDDVREQLTSDSEGEQFAWNSFNSVSIARQTASQLGAHSGLHEPARNHKRRALSLKTIGLKTATVCLCSMALLVVAGGWWLFGSDSSGSQIGGVRGAALLSSDDCSWKFPDRVDSESSRTVTLTCVACHLSLEHPR